MATVELPCGTLALQPVAHPTARQLVLAHRVPTRPRQLRPIVPCQIRLAVRLDNVARRCLEIACSCTASSSERPSILLVPDCAGLRVQLGLV